MTVSGSFASTFFVISYVNFLASSVFELTTDRSSIKIMGSNLLDSAEVKLTKNVINKI